MKKYLLLSLILAATLGFICSPAKLMAQIDILNGTINGAPINKMTTNDSKTDTYIRGFVTTRRDIYWLTERGYPNYFINTTTNIVDIASKIGADTATALILLADGSAMLVQVKAFANGSNTTRKLLKSSDSSLISKTFDKIQGDDIYVLSSVGFYVTRDLGKSWQWDTTGLNGDRINDFTIDQSQNVYAVGNKAMYQQAAKGKTWSKMSTPNGSGFQKIFIDRMGRIATCTNSFGGVYIYTNSTWTIDTAGLGHLFVQKFCDDAYGNLYLIATDFKSTFIFKSAGGTGDWKRTDPGLLNVAGTNVSVNTIMGDSTLWAGTSFGLFVSYDQGSTWQAENDSIRAETANSLVKSSKNNILITTDLGLYKLNGAETSWSHSFPVSGYNSKLSIYGDNLGNLFLLDPTVNNYRATPMWKSTDNGASWLIDTAGLSAIDGSLFFIDETGAQHFANSFYGGLYKSAIWTRKPGGSWVADNTNIPSASYSYFSAMGSDRQGNLYASGYLGSTINKNMIYSRTINGNSWQPDTAGLNSSGITHMNSGGKAGILAWNTSSIFHKSGNIWKQISLPALLGYPTVSAVSVDSNSVVFVAFTDYSGQSSGIFYTKDTGATWTYAGLAKTTVNSMISYGDTTYVLTDASWVYKITAKPYKGSGIELISPFLNNISAYPNPATSEIKIRYNLNTAGYISIELYDVQGKKISSSQTGLQPPGDHIYSIQSGNLKPGIYIYRISEGNKFCFGKIIKE